MGDGRASTIASVVAPRGPPPVLVPRPVLAPPPVVRAPTWKEQRRGGVVARVVGGNGLSSVTPAAAARAAVRSSPRRSSRRRPDLAPPPSDVAHVAASSSNSSSLFPRGTAGMTLDGGVALDGDAAGGGGGATRSPSSSLLPFQANRGARGRTTVGWAMAIMLQPVLPFLLLVLAASAAAGLPGDRTLVFILAGQSNMSGRGGATSGTWDGVVPPECAPSPRILRLSPALRWEEAREPLHAGIDVGNVLGVGPGMPFAHAVLGTSGKVPPGAAAVGLVPCAQGGTPIANWTRGTELYERMVTRARAALDGCHGRGELAAMLWYQGEGDTMRRDDAERYQGRMEALVRDVRRDLGRPDLLVVQVGIATAQYNGKFLDRVREAQKAVTLAVPNIKYVDAMGLPIASDNTHLTTQAQVQLGNMLAKSYLETL
ncbi:putative carbohydrate esterase [Dichanthelium oligosanthes]|uniref:Putative carbohydrate esterase n=1 Tax=Dichanthelium oligosanthes TaxID=888268 RepID=A0A1E5VTA1_9POAL|nr:putative carbohydrate esterase [Dichanthelium oligosanthes]